VHNPTGWVDPFGLTWDGCGKLKWRNPKSKPTYGHTFIDHGQKLKPQQLMDRVVVKPDGSIRASFPYNSSHPN